MDTHSIISAVIAIVLALAGWLFRIYADKQKQLSDAHDTKLKELEDAHGTKLKELEAENREQLKAQHAIDLRLTGAEASLHATKNNVTEIKDELADIRVHMVRREDLQTTTDILIQRIDAIGTRKR